MCSRGVLPSRFVLIELLVTPACTSATAICDCEGTARKMGCTARNKSPHRTIRMHQTHLNISALQAQPQSNHRPFHAPNRSPTTPSRKHRPHAHTRNTRPASTPPATARKRVFVAMLGTAPSVKLFMLKCSPLGDIGESASMPAQRRCGLRHFVEGSRRHKAMPE